MSRRRPSSTQTSDFFAFQDIITSTTGILLVITLLLALTVGKARINDVMEQRSRLKQAQAEAEQSQAEVARLNENFSILKAEAKQRERLARELEAAKAELAAYVQAEVNMLVEGKAEPEPPVPNLYTIKAEDQEQYEFVVFSSGKAEFLDTSGQSREFDYTYSDYNLVVRLEQPFQEQKTLVVLIKPSAFNDYLLIQELTGGIPPSHVTVDLVPENWNFKHAP